jgi:DNA ligase (NAD+)
MKNFLDYAAKRYYAGQPVISDAEFDRLAEENDYVSVGADTRHGIPHHYSMWSLKKCYVGEKQIELDGETVETPKFDGAAVSILYIGGELVMALTRGDGKRGEDITEKMKWLAPSRIKITETVQVTGEVMAPKSITNSRNYAAGALNLKDIEEFKQRELFFVAYGLQPNLNPTYKEDMELLTASGIRNVIDDTTLENFYPTDGRVFRLNKYVEFDKAGFTSNHPRGAYALKERSEGVRTTLLDVTWQVGRSGVVSPVAILAPVKVGDATVSRATLHNMKYIEGLNLEIGCDVEIVRSGEIIPRVVRRV